jgi:hypothetical protein
MYKLFNTICTTWGNLKNSFAVPKWRKNADLGNSSCTYLCRKDYHM